MEIARTTAASRRAEKSTVTPSSVLVVSLYTLQHTPDTALVPPTWTRLCSANARAAASSVLIQANGRPTQVVREVTSMASLCKVVMLLATPAQLLAQSLDDSHAVTLSAIEYI